MTGIASHQGKSPVGRIARFVLPAALAALAFAPMAKAQSILIDFGNDSSFRGVSVPAPDSKGHFWNSNAPGNTIPLLKDSANATTNVGLGWDTPVGTDSFNGPAGATSFPHPTPAEVAVAAGKINNPTSQAALGNLAIAEAIIDFAASSSNGSPCVFDISGLDPTKSYTFRLYGSHIFSDNQQTTYTVGQGLNGSTFAVTNVIASGSINVQEIDTNDPGNPPNIPNTTQVATLTGLHSNANGVLYVNIAGAQGALGYLNAMEISVPEPTSLSLVGAGLVMVARRRRR